MPRRARHSQDDPPDPPHSVTDAGSLFATTPAERAMELVAPAVVPEHVRALAAGLPTCVRLGTSSWAYPGWRGLVYARNTAANRLARDGLAAYAHWPLFRTVGLDRAFYSAPTEQEFRALASVVPPGFQFLVKADQRLVRPDADARGETFGSTTALRASGIRNPHFLDAQMAHHEIIEPARRGLGAALGPIVLQFPHLDLGAAGHLGGAEGFLESLHAFLMALATQARSSIDAGAAGAENLPPILAVEVRNRELLRAPHVRRYAQVLADSGAVHSYLQHPSAPPIAEQEAALRAVDGGALSFRALVIRWMLRSDSSYEAASDRFEPFDQLRAPDPGPRAEIAALLRLASPARPGFVVCNNKAEGSAVLTVEQLAAELADARAG